MIPSPTHARIQAALDLVFTIFDQSIIKSFK